MNRRNLFPAFKRLTAVVLLLILCMGMTMPVLAEDAYNSSLYRVNDFYGAMDSDVFEDVEAIAYDSIPEYQFDFPVVLLDSAELDGTSLQKFCAYYYSNNEYGYGSDHDGILLAVTPDNEEFLITAYGRGESIFQKDKINQLSEQFYGDYRSLGVTKAVENYLKLAQATVLPPDVARTDETDSPEEQDAGTGASADESEAAGEKLTEYGMPAVDSSVKVYDFADIFTDAEEAKMAELIENINTRYAKDYVIYTDADSSDRSHGLAAADFYWDNGYGIGSDRSGGILFICMEPGNRGWWSAGTGSVQPIFTERTINKLDDRLEPYMVDGNYGAGVISYLEDLDVLFDTGKVPRTRHPVVAILIGIITGLLGAGVMAGIQTAMMKTTGKVKTAANYVVPNSLILKDQRDFFVRKVVTRTKRQTSSSSSSGKSSYSGSYRSSGGGSFSGGGRKF